MMTKRIVVRTLLSSLFGVITFFFAGVALAADSVTLYTPNTKVSVPPGESVSYSIDAINNSEEVQNLDLRLYGIPKGWEYSLKSGAYQVSEERKRPSR